MPELRSYLKPQVPRDLAVQIASYVRVQWPALLDRRTPLWESTPYPPDGRHFVLSDGDLLIAHALTHRRRLDHLGQSWIVGALSSVFVYPTHRGSGYGDQIVRAATAELRSGETDFSLLFCGERVRSLYIRNGSAHVPDLEIAYGDARSPLLLNKTHPKGYTLALPGSARAAENWSRIESAPLYVGPSTW